MKRYMRFQKLGFFIAILALITLSCQGVAGFNPFATPTPTATATFTPTPTFTPSPTPSSTPTPTITPTPEPTGVQTEIQSDGSTLFIDHDNKYQLILPKGWTVIPFDKDSFSAVLDDIAKDNPNLAESAKIFKDLDPSIFRLVALNTNPKFLVNNFASNLNITAIDNSVLSAMPLSFVTGALEESFKQQGITVLTTGVNTIDNEQGVEIEYVDMEQTIKGEKAAQRAIVFQSNKKLIILTFSTAKQMSQDIFKEGDLIAGSIKLLP